MSDDGRDPGDAGDRRGSSPTERQRRRVKLEATQPSSASAPGGPAAQASNDVLHLLESCQLTDEEADELLKDAYALNRLLRAHLSHVEASNDSGTRGHQRGSSGGTSAGSAAVPQSGKSRQSSGGGGGGGFSRQLGGGAGRHEQSSSRRSVSLSGRTQVAATSGNQQQRLPPIARAKSPGQRLSEMARAYSSGVVQAGHRGGRGESSSSGVPDASKSAKKRL